MSNTAVDKNQAIITFIKTCPSITSGKLFFNFGNIEDGAFQANIQSDEVALQKPFIDGSVLKKYTFNLDNFKSIAYNPIVSLSGSLTNENLADLSDVQAVSDWINEQGLANVFPNFGSDCIIEKMETVTARPTLVGINTQLTPPMAIYRISVRIDYIDKTNTIWT